MGNVRKRGKSYQLIYQVNGQRQWPTVHVENRSEAVRLLKIAEGKANDGRRSPLSAERLRLEDLGADLINDYVVRNNRSAWRAEISVRHLNSFFGTRRADQITTADVRAYVVHRKEAGASAGTINRELAALKRMYNLALRAELLFRKPDIPGLREAPPRQGFFEPEVYCRVLAELPQHLKPVVEFAYNTGWRRSEITRLQRTQVDLAARIIRLWPGTTKNGEGRTLPLEGELWRIVQEQFQRKVSDCPWLFHRAGKPIGDFQETWRDAAARAGCAGMRFHDFRRTLARNLRRAGLSEDEAMKLTGHKTSSIFRRYCIIAESDLREAALRAQIYLSGIHSNIAQQVSPVEGDPQEKTQLQALKCAESVPKPHFGRFKGEKNSRQVFESK